MRHFHFIIVVVLLFNQTLYALKQKEITMKPVTVSLKLNMSATLFKTLTITQKGVSFIDYQTAPFLDFEEHPVVSEPSHVMRISFSLEELGLLSDHTMSIDKDENKSENSVIWQGYKISVKNIHGYSESEVTFVVEQLSQEERSYLDKTREKVTAFNKQLVTAILSYNKPIKVFDTFTITLKGIRQDTYTSKPNQPSQTKEKILLHLDGLGVSEQLSLVTEKEGNDSILLWQAYKIGYLKHNKAEVRVYVEELPDEEVEKSPSFWERLSPFH